MADSRMVEMINNQILSLSVALGIGLLIGAEREQKKALRNARVAVGIRSFTVASLSGAVAGMIQNTFVLPVTLMAIAMLLSISYVSTKSNGQGLTSELSLLLTFLLGALCIFDLNLAAGLGVIVAAVLASREWLHQFVKRIMSERELHDVIIFFSVLLVFLPIAPDRYFGPYKSINLYEIAQFVMMVIGISALGYILKRALGTKGGLAMAGFLGGFVSSTTVVMKMGQYSKANPLSTQHAIGSTLLSNVATLIQLIVILYVTLNVFEIRMLWPIAYGLIAAFLLPWFYVLRGKISDQTQAAELGAGAFDLKSSIIFTLLVTGLNLVTSALYAWLGPTGVLITSALAGLTDAHANISSVTSLHNKGDISLQQVELAVLYAYTANSVSKILVALTFGNNQFKFHVCGGIIILVSMIWMGYILHSAP